jgi:hypothetical protein
MPFAYFQTLQFRIHRDMQEFVQFCTVGSSKSSRPLGIPQPVPNIEYRQTLWGCKISLLRKHNLENPANFAVWNATAELLLCRVINNTILDNLARFKADCSFVFDVLIQTFCWSNPTVNIVLTAQGWLNLVLQYLIPSVSTILLYKVVSCCSSVQLVKICDNIWNSQITQSFLVTGMSCDNTCYRQDLS